MSWTTASGSLARSFERRVHPQANRQAHSRVEFREQWPRRHGLALVHEQAHDATADFDPRGAWAFVHGQADLLMSGAVFKMGLADGSLPAVAAQVTGDLLDGLAAGGRALR